MGSGSEAVHKWIQGAWVHNVLDCFYSGKQPTGMIVHCCEYRAGHRKVSLISKSICWCFIDMIIIHTPVSTCVYMIIILNSTCIQE